MKNFNFRYLLIFALFSSAFQSSFLFAQKSKHVKVLAIGNSFSNDATTYLPQITKGATTPCTLTLGRASIGGCDLERHLRHVDLFEKNQDDPNGKPYVNNTKSLREMLTEEKWDYVTIQQVSTKSFKTETYYPHAKKLHDYIKKYAPQAEVVIHQTWAYRGDEPRFGTTFCHSQQAMYQGLCESYSKIARELGCRLIRSGDAMELARRSPMWGGVFPDPDFDRKTATYSSLPDQRRSLHVGFFWKKEGNQWKLQYDGIHANVAGDYLTGCVWFEFFFEISPIDNHFVPDKLDSKDAEILRKIAHEVIGYEFGLGQRLSDSLNVFDSQ